MWDIKVQLSLTWFLCPASAAGWFIQGCAMCYHVYVIMHVKDPYLCVIGVGHCVMLADFCFPLYSLQVLYKDVNIIQL